MNRLSPLDTSDIENRALRVVEILSTKFPSRSGLTPSALAGAGEFIHREFQILDYEVDRQVFPTRGNEAYNLVAVKHGRNPAKPVLVIGAHYDTVGSTPGADDNASGIAGVLELSRLLKDYPTERTIHFVAFSHEEPPFFFTRHMGSRHCARSFKRSQTRIELMLCLEMIGYAGEKMGQEYPFLFLRQLGRYPKHGNFIGIAGNLRSRKKLTVVKNAMRQFSTIGVESLTAPGFLPPLYLSDHSSFWKYGYPAIMITDTAFLRNPHYHLPTDTVETLNYRFLAEVVKGVFYAVLELDRVE